MTNQINLYAVQHGKGNLNILEDEIRTFIAVLLLPGYCKVPYQNLYWADAPDTHNEAVSCAMNRNRFREILSISNSMVPLSITALMKALSLTTENTAQNNLLEESALGLVLNFGASPHLKDISLPHSYC